jgi:hypothetical protein
MGTHFEPRKTRASVGASLVRIDWSAQTFAAGHVSFAVVR